MYTLCQVAVLVCALGVAVTQADKIYLRIPPSILPNKKSSHILYKNDIEVILPCIATGTPSPTYEWIRDGEVLDLNAANMHANPNVGTISIKPITSLDEGYYQCRAMNMYGTSVSKVFFLQRATFGRYPPTSIQNYTKKEGMPLELKCFEIKSVPSPSYSWAFVKTTVDDNPVGLIASRRIIQDENGNLFFTYLKKGDARIVADSANPNVLNSWLYKCNVFNSHLDFSTGGSYSRITVTDGDLSDRPPTLQHKTESPYIAVKGSKIRLQCIFAGMPEVFVTWEPIPGGRSTIDEHGTVLIIDDTEFSDGKVYTCTAKNKAGVKRETITVDVQSAPQFLLHPTNLNVTEMDTVSVECQASPDTKPPAIIQWFINGEPVDPARPGPRTEITDGGQRLTINNLCKDCQNMEGQSASDLKVIQCNASNVHGYVFADGYLNVLLKTVIYTKPEDQIIDHDTSFAVFDCEASSDASTPVSITWQYKLKQLSYYGDKRFVVNATSDSLTVLLEGLEYEAKKKYQGVYTCHATNLYSSQERVAKLTIEYTGIPVVAAAGKIWWIFLIIALILLLLILLLCCCICVQRNRGDAYPVDEKERKEGNDPEKECADSGFHDYHRPEDGPVKGSRASLTSTIKLDSDDEGSLAEYGDIDTGKFNEDGSFIGQYMTDKKKKQSNV